METPTGERGRRRFRTRKGRDGCLAGFLPTLWQPVHPAWHVSSPRPLRVLSLRAAGFLQGKHWRPRIEESCDGAWLVEHGSICPYCLGQYNCFLGTLFLLAIMFVLVEMTDTVRIPPWQFERKLNDAITEELNKKLANKVVYNVGLCICLYDITKLEDSYIFPGDGASHTKVHFRYVVFHPFLDEILVGEIKGCSLEGVRVSLGFFDDIIIPPESLQQPAKFDEAEQVWVWEYETEEGAHDLYMDTGEEIRFRVVDETFIDTSPTGPSSAQPSTSGAADEAQKKEAPYTLVGSISEPGLGLLSWWTNS